MKQLIRVALLLVMFSQLTYADLVLQFGQGNTPGLSTFSAAPNSSLVLQLYLTQTGTETRLSSSATGLVIADFQVGLSGGGGVTPFATSFGTGFSDDGSMNTGITGLTARIAEFVTGGNSAVGVTTATDGVNDNSILLGTLTLQVGNSATGPINLTITQRPELGSLSLADPGLPLSVLATAGAATLNITAVPEPSAFLMVAVGVAFGAFRRGPRKIRTI